MFYFICSQKKHWKKTKMTGTNFRAVLGNETEFWKEGVNCHIPFTVPIFQRLVYLEIIVITVL